MQQYIETTKIALRISGTKQRRAGFTPLVSVGVLAGDEGDGMDRVTNIDEKPVYIIKHAADYILYGAIDRQVKSFDADAKGVLSIALTVKKNVKLAGGKSPYTLLNEVYETFRREYMRSMEDGRDEFLDKDIEDGVFREILAKYPLEPYKGLYIPMNVNGPSAIVKVIEETKKEELFKDSQYKEFERYKEIEVGRNSESTLALKNLKIPRPQTYSIYVNGQHKRNTENVDEVIFAEDVPSEIFEYQPVTFKIADVLSKTNFTLKIEGAEIKLNSKTNEVICTLESRPVEYEVRVQPKYDNAFGERFKLMFGENDISEKRKVEASALLKPTSKIKFWISDNGKWSKYKVTKTVNRDKRVVNLNIEIEEEKYPSTLNKVPYAPEAISKNDGNVEDLRKKNSELDSELSEQKRIYNELREKYEILRQRTLVYISILAFFLGIVLGAGGFWGTRKVYVKYWHNNEIEDSVSRENSDTIGQKDGDSITVRQDSSTLEEPANVGQGELNEITKQKKRENMINFACDIKAHHTLEQCKVQQGWANLTSEEKEMITNVYSALTEAEKMKSELNATGKQKLENEIVKELVEKEMLDWNQMKLYSDKIKSIQKNYKMHK